MDFFSHLGRWLSDERFTANLIAAHGAIVVVVIVALVLRRLLVAGHNRLKRLSDQPSLEALTNQAVRHGHTLLFWLTLTAVVGTLISGVVYHLIGRDIRGDLGDWAEQLTAEHLIRAGIALGGLVGAWIGCRLMVRALRGLLPWLEMHVKQWVGHRNNEQALCHWFVLLERFVCASSRLIAVWAAGHAVGLGYLADTVVGFVLKLVSVLAIARLLTLGFRTVTHAAVERGNRQFTPTTWRRYWERITGLFPFADRCFEAAVYVSAAWFVVHLLHDAIPELAKTQLGPRIVACIGIFFCTRVLIELLQVLLHEAFGMYAEHRPINQKGRTLVPLLHSIGQYVLYFGSVIAMLGVFDISAAPILAGAGIVGLAVGLGAQTLVTDFVSGFFILFENQFLVGDYVQINDAHGVVEEVALRTTHIRDGNGKLHIIPNGQIKGVTSYSKGYVNAVVDYKTPAGSDLESIFRAMKEAGRQVRLARKEVLADTEIHGIIDMGASDMTVRAVTRVEPGTHGIVQSEFRRVLKQILDQQQPVKKPALAA
jgi:moderate conductance mechanosensitive channel